MFPDSNHNYCDLIIIRHKIFKYFSKLQKSSFNGHEIRCNQVLSTVPVMFSYAAKPEDTRDLSILLNDHLIDICKKYPKRFLGISKHMKIHLCDSYNRAICSAGHAPDASARPCRGRTASNYAISWSANFYFSVTVTLFI